VSTTAAVRAHARSLEEKGFLVLIMQIGTTNRFNLTPLFKRLECLMNDDQQPGSPSQGSDSAFIQNSQFAHSTNAN
jgi:hypothetical protein